MESLLSSIPASFALDNWQALAIEGILRATLVLAAACCVVVAMWQSSASVRHLVWTSALAGTLALPALMLVLPSWRVPIPPRAQTQVQIIPVIGHAMRSNVSVPVEADFQSDRATVDSTRRSRKVDPPGSYLDPPMGDVPSSRSATENWTFWIVAVWGVGAVIVLLPMLSGMSRLRRITRQSKRSVDGPWVELADCLGGSPLRSRRVVMLQGDVSTSPMTWGVLHPVILLPSGVETWRDERLRAVLLHELAHVQRCDCLTLILARLSCALYWFHPLVWIAARQHRIESERACDDLVLHSGARATDYARDLLDIARAVHSARGIAAAAVPMARPVQLEGRLRAILDPSRSRRVVSRGRACLLFAAAAVVLLPLSVVRLAPGSEELTAKVQNGEEGRPARSARMSVAGRVLDPDGRPVSGARVVILGRRILAALTARSDDQHHVLGRAESDALGRFRLDVPRTSSLTYYELHALASRPGFGLGWSKMNRDAEGPSADVRLKPEQLIEGRLVDLQGVPAAGVTIRAANMGVAKQGGGRYDGINLAKRPLPGLEDVWPGPSVSDAEGRFRLSGIGRSMQFGLKVEDPRFARQSLGAATDDKEVPKRITLALQPAMHIAGQITRGDTGAPLADALVVVGSGQKSWVTTSDEFRTDARGRYDANPPSGKYVEVTVYPPIGSPYLIFQRNFESDDGAAQREIDVAVPRGVLLTGRITERGTGKPLAGASVFYENGQSNVVEGKGTIPGWMSAISSGPDGRYAIAVASGKGQLLVYGATGDFVHEMKGDHELDTGKPGGQRLYAHAFVPYEVKEGQEPIQLDVVLKPGVTIEGRVVGPEGQTVEMAEIVTTLSISPFHTFWRGDFTVPVRDGHFELHGLAPDRQYKCSFLDAEHGWGATLRLTAAMAADGPITVRLGPCGRAKARLVDEQGRAVPKSMLSLSLVGTPGRGIHFGGGSLTDEERKMLEADEVIYANVDRANYWEARRSDRQGHVSLPFLIPGASYRIYEYTRGKSGHDYRWRDFSVEAGRETDLGDVRVKAEGR
jgi:beta-lactamase regulating signal transducer with metallopeptidase domain